MCRFSSFPNRFNLTFKDKDLLKTKPLSQDFTFVREMVDLGTKLLGDDVVVRESKRWNWSFVAWKFPNLSCNRGHHFYHTDCWYGLFLRFSSLNLVANYENRKYCAKRRNRKKNNRDFTVLLFACLLFSVGIIQFSWNVYFKSSAANCFKQDWGGIIQFQPGQREIVKCIYLSDES